MSLREASASHSTLSSTDCREQVQMIINLTSTGGWKNCAVMGQPYPSLSLSQESTRLAHVSHYSKRISTREEQSEPVFLGLPTNDKDSNRDHRGHHLLEA